MKICKFVVLLFVFSCSHSPPQNLNIPTLPSPEVRRQMVTDLKNEIDRLDGDGLLARTHRSESWQITTSKLAEEAAQAKTLFDLGRVFKRLDATYPNLHARVFMIPELDEKKSNGAVILPFHFSAEKIDVQNTSPTYRITLNDKNYSLLKNGDELLEINSIPMQKWSEENFNFCKFPYRSQCEVEFFDNFKNELLGWNRHLPLDLKIKRSSQILTVSIQPRIKPLSSASDEENTDLPCEVQKNRYPGFHIVYEGQNLCAFESAKYPLLTVLRIKSFQYDDVPFAVLDGEVKIFWNNYWKKKSPVTKTLILDVINNYGGQSPIPYYGLFYSQPYQEQYVQFKKISEFQQKEILESLFWGDKGKEIWFQNILQDGAFAKTVEGDFLSPIPQFCANPKKDCREDLFQPLKNNFKGQVRVLMDHWCVSSCVGFVSNIKSLLKDKVQMIGFPDSGDSAYSRLSIFVNPSDMNGGSSKIKIAPSKKARNPDSPVPWVRQVVSVTRSTNKEGFIISGTPQSMDKWVPKYWNQSQDQWATAVFQQALQTVHQ